MHSSDMRAHQMRDADDRWRWWLARHNLSERETQTRGNLAAHLSFAQRRTKGGGDGWTLAQHTPIRCEIRTMGGGGGWRSTPPSNARRERQEVVTGAAHPIECETRTIGGGGGWRSTPPSNARHERQDVVGGTAHPHRMRDAKDGRRWWLAKHTPIERGTQMTGGGGG